MNLVVYKGMPHNVVGIDIEGALRLGCRLYVWKGGLNLTLDRPIIVTFNFNCPQALIVRTQKIPQYIPLQTINP